MDINLSPEEIAEYRRAYKAVDPEELESRPGSFDGQITDEDIIYYKAGAAKLILEQAGIPFEED